MKVLLIGDYSGFHKNLATGLRQHAGVIAHVASSGDGFKRFEQDILYGGGRQRSFKKKINDFSRFATWFNQYDVIQMINVGGVDAASTIYSYIRSFFPMRAKVYCAAVGSDYKYWTTGRKVLKMPLFDEIEKNNETACDSLRDKIAFKIVNATVRGFLAVNEYYESYANVKKRLSPVLLPIDLAELNYEPFILNRNDKMIIFHGLQKNREGFKGSHHILEAFAILNKKYASDLKCVSEANLPYPDYLSTLKGIHVLVDQTNGISYGMNALIGMAMGKIVASGSQDPLFMNKWCNMHGFDRKPPLYPILPDKSQIISQIEKMLDERESLVNVSQAGRLFVEKYHDCKRVAEIFLNRWSST